jgi:predicted ribosome quality control (RQC) complex YloA/Tae2 family protein
MTTPLLFDTFTLAAVAAELRALVVPARVQKIQQPSPHELVLSLYGHTGARRLLVSVDPQRFRVHLTQVRRESPVTPPAFAAVCRKYLAGARLDDVLLPRFDRVLHLVFHAHDGERVTLAAELMGRNANLVLVSGTGVVRGVLRAAPAGERPLRVGAPYADPPGLDAKRDPRTPPLGDDDFAALPDNPEDARRWLVETFGGIGRFAADEVWARAGGEVGRVPDALRSLMDEVWEARFAPHSILGDDGSTAGVWAFEPQSVPRGRRFPRESVSVALDTFHATLAERTEEGSERDRLAKALAREIAFREKERAAAQKTRAEAERADSHERAGNLLLAHLPQIDRGASSVTLPDLYADAGGTISIALDPKRSPQENADAYFERARKARDAAVYAEKRLADLQAQLALLGAVGADLERAGDAQALGRVRQALAEIAGAGRVAAAPSPVSRGPKEKPWNGHRVRTYTIDGFTLLVGETAEANDYLTTRVAAPSDLWMHVRAGTGAHGVLRTGGKPQALPDAVVRRAAEIVAARSGTAVKHAGVVAVDVVERKHVRKPRGAKPGLVTYSRERSLDVSPSL